LTTCDPGQKDVPDDMKHHDYVGRGVDDYPDPDISTAKKVLLGPAGDWDVIKSILAGQTNQELESILRKALEGYAGSLGKDIVAHFMNGGGKPYVHEGSMPLAKAFRQHEKTRQALADLFNSLWWSLREKFLSRQKKSQRGALPASLAYLNNIYLFPEAVMPYTAWSSIGMLVKAKLPGSSDQDKLVSIIGGTKCTKLFVKGLAETSKGLKFRYRWELTDHFGVDASDLYDLALGAFWILQHGRAGPQLPFCNVLVHEDEMELTYR
jgi:hypothetical protein